MERLIMLLDNNFIKFANELYSLEGNKELRVVCVKKTRPAILQALMEVSGLKTSTVWTTTVNDESNYYHKATDKSVCVFSSLHLATNANVGSTRQNGEMKKIFSANAQSGQVTFKVNDEPRLWLAPIITIINDEQGEFLPDTSIHYRVPVIDFSGFDTEEEVKEAYEEAVRMVEPSGYEYDFKGMNSMSEKLKVKAAHAILSVTGAIQGTDGLAYIRPIALRTMDLGLKRKMLQSGLLHQCEKNKRLQGKVAQFYYYDAFALHTIINEANIAMQPVDAEVSPEDDLKQIEKQLEVEVELNVKHTLRSKDVNAEAKTTTFGNMVYFNQPKDEYGMYCDNYNPAVDTDIKQVKQNLDYFYNGVDLETKEYNGTRNIIVLDIDNHDGTKELPEVNDLADRLTEENLQAHVFPSTSHYSDEAADGIKMYVLADGIIESDAELKAAAQQVAALLNIDLDLIDEKSYNAKWLMAFPMVYSDVRSVYGSAAFDLTEAKEIAKREQREQQAELDAKLRAIETRKEQQAFNDYNNSNSNSVKGIETLADVQAYAQKKHPEEVDVLENNIEGYRHNALVKLSGMMAGLRAAGVNESALDDYQNYVTTLPGYTDDAESFNALAAFF
jgi:hypothetical protein